MAKHTVEFRTPALDVPRVDVFFRIKQGKHAFGRLRISKGGVEWMQKNDKKRAYHMNWEKFDAVSVAEGLKGRTQSKKGRKKK